MKYSVSRRAYQRRTLPAGTPLGQAPDRPARALIERGLLNMGVPAVFVLANPLDERGAFRIRTADVEQLLTVREARAFIQGVLGALNPSDPLADVLTTSHGIFANPLGGGRVLAAWQFGCSHPGCVVFATVRQADYERAISVVEYHGWRRAEDGDYLCPHHAAEQAVAA